MVIRGPLRNEINELLKLILEQTAGILLILAPTVIFKGREKQSLKFRLPTVALSADILAIRQQTLD